MPAYASFDPPPIPLGRPSTPVGVYRYQPAQSPQYEFLPNIRVLRIQFIEGPDPGVATFRYVFDASNSTTDPTSFQQALSTDSGLPGVVNNDDRLVVFCVTPDGTQLALFDGFAQVPELRLSASHEIVAFKAMGVAIRAWDTPICGALERSADAPSSVNDVETDLLTYFNPAGQPNASPQGADATDRFGNQFATFLDPLVVRSPEQRRYWTIPMAVRYLCYHQNADQKYIKNPDGSSIDAILDSRAPKDGVAYNPNDPSTYTSEPILVPDYPATGKVWPVVVHDLVEPNGCGMAFRLCTDPNGNPYTSLEIFRRQDGSTSAFKDLYLQTYGALLDPAQTNLGQAHLARDVSGIANSYTVVSDLTKYEASFILAPGFAVSASDATDSTALSAYDKNNPTFGSSSHDKYRLYVFDETGEGHWDFSNGSTVKTIPSLSSLFQDQAGNPSTYVIRRRVPIGWLLTLDPNEKPLTAQLSISTNYNGKQPGLWDGTGSWQTVTGGFELLKDRLGIWINVQNPNGWNIGPSYVAGAPFPAGIVKGVEDQANSGAPHFALRLTCVIEGDHTLAANAAKRLNSPTSYTVLRTVDARDRYSLSIKAPESEFNQTGNAVVMRDDSASAQSDANARRLANECGEVAGTVTIPRFTDAYRIGDRVRSIQGRGLSLRTNAGAPTEEAEVYPAVIGLVWDFDGSQRTILQLSDRRGDPSW